MYHDLQHPGEQEVISAQGPALPGNQHDITYRTSREQAAHYLQRPGFCCTGGVADMAVVISVGISGAGCLDAVSQPSGRFRPSRRVDAMSRRFVPSLLVVRRQAEAAARVADSEFGRR